MGTSTNQLVDVSGAPVGGFNVEHTQPLQVEAHTRPMYSSYSSRTHYKRCSTSLSLLTNGPCGMLKVDGKAGRYRRWWYVIEYILVGDSSLTFFLPQTTASWRALANYARDNIVRATPSDLALILQVSYTKARRPSQGTYLFLYPHSCGIFVFTPFSISFSHISTIKSYPPSLTQSDNLP